jgi:iron complex outermembrane recepter protein
MPRRSSRSSVSPASSSSTGSRSTTAFATACLYERGPLSARLTYTGRSNFLAFRDNRGTSDPYREFGDPNDRLDMSINYNVLENLTVFADWTNITMNPFKVNFSSARDGRPEAVYPRYLRYDESTVSLGVRFRFGK